MKLLVLPCALLCALVNVAFSQSADSLVLERRDYKAPIRGATGPTSTSDKWDVSLDSSGNIIARKSDGTTMTLAGVDSLKGLTGALTIAVGTSGQGLAGSASGLTITLDMSAASATAVGQITKGTQTMAGAKTLSSVSLIPTLTPNQIVVAGASGALSGNDNLTFDGATLTLRSVGSSSIPLTLNALGDGRIQKWTKEPESTEDPSKPPSVQPVYWYFQPRPFNGTTDDVFGFRYNPEKNSNRPWMQWSWEGDYNTGSLDSNNNPVHLLEHNWDYLYNGQTRRPFSFNIDLSTHQAEFGFNGRILHTLVDYPTSGIFYNYALGSGGTSHRSITGWNESGDYADGVFHRWTNTNTSAGTLDFRYYTQGSGSINFKFGKDAGENQFDHTISIINADQSYRHYAPNGALTQLIDAKGNFLVGRGSALEANAANGFLFVPRISGTPSGSPPDYGYAVPMAFQEGATDKLWFRRTDGTWVFIPVVSGPTGSGSAALTTLPELTTPKITTSLLDANGNTLINIGATALAVNYVKVTNATAGNAAAISADGETNASLIIDAKGTGAVKFNHATVQTPVFLTDQEMIATDVSLGNHFRVTLDSHHTLGGHRTLGNPANPTDGQVVVWEIIQDAAGGQTLSYQSKFVVGAELNNATISSGPNTHSFITARYNSVSDRWHIIGVLTGY